MQGFGRSWMSFTRSVNPRILELIQREDCSVEELLEANATNDINSQNEQVLKFFTHEKLGELIDLITVMPSEEDTHDRQHRFPFQANEIFGFEINAFLDKFFEAPEPVTPKAKAEDTTIIKAGDDHTIDSKNTDDGDDEEEEVMRITIDKDEDDRDYGYQHIEQEEGKTEPQNDNSGHLEEENQDKLEQIDTPINRKNSGGSSSGSHSGRPDIEMPALMKQSDLEKETEENKEAQEQIQEQTQIVEEKLEDPVENGKAEDTIEDQEYIQNQQQLEEDKKVEEPADISNQDLNEQTDNQQKQVQEDPKQEEVVEEIQEQEQEVQAVVDQQPDFDHTDQKLEDKQEILNQIDEEQTQIEGLGEPENEDQLTEQLDDNKYQLLERLFNFLETKETPLNPVLSGYFQNLVNTLLIRRQKQFVPYLFKEAQSTIDNMLYHLQQKSISDIVKKLMVVTASDYDEAVASCIINQQEVIMSTLVDKLGFDTSEEDNLNAAMIINDLIELKDCYNMITMKMYIQDIFEKAFPTYIESSDSSRCAALSVLTKILKLYPDNQKREKRNQAVKKKETFSFSLGTQESDVGADEDESPLILVLMQNQSTIFESLQQLEVNQTQLETTYLQPIVPLGRLRLKIIEFIRQLTCLNNPALLSYLVDSTILSDITELVLQYPWNNFLQLTVIQIFQDLLDNCEDPEVKVAALRSSQITQKLVSTIDKTEFEFGSQRLMRHGYMGLVIKIANLIEQHKDDEDIGEYLEEFCDSWPKFFENEVCVRNLINSKQLGNRNNQDNNSDEDDEDQDLKFHTSDNLLAQGYQLYQTGKDDDDEDEEDNDDHNTATYNLNDDEDQNQHDHVQVHNHHYPMKQIETKVNELEAAQNLHHGFVDNNYWKVDAEGDLDELLKDYE
eukprot:403375243